MQKDSFHCSTNREHRNFRKLLDDKLKKSGFPLVESKTIH